MGRIPIPPMKYPLIAILRGLKPQEAEGVVAALLETGFAAIEIPLNSPDPFHSIEIAVKMVPANVLVGAGTVLRASQVDRLDDVGGRLMVSPNVEPSVIDRAVSKGMVTFPGVFTATEALAAARAGASGLKFFPANVLGLSGISAIRSILPDGPEIAAVGGVSGRDFFEYKKIGIRCFGIGSSLYLPGMNPAEVKRRAAAILAAYDQAFPLPGSREVAS